MFQFAWYSCYFLLVELSTIGSHSVAEMKINWGKIWNPPGFSCCCLSCGVGHTKHYSGLTVRFQGVSWGKAILAGGQDKHALSLSSVAAGTCGPVTFTGRIAGLLHYNFLSAVKAPVGQWRVGRFTYNTEQSSVNSGPAVSCICSRRSLCIWVPHNLS